MPTDSISFKETGYFSQLICDYLAEAETLSPFINRFPKLENFKAQIEEKQGAFNNDNRAVLVEVLKQQYKNLETSVATNSNINALLGSNTFTITTGHQLNLFTGPLYFLHKIVSAINLAKQLKKEYPESNFVPVYWMASEDHDFDEINYFNFKGGKIQWDKKAGGAVGDLNTEGLASVLEAFSKQLGSGTNAKQLKALFKKAYLDHASLAAATQYLANVLFGDYGLVVLDANHKELKRLFVPYIKTELFDNTAFSTVINASKQLTGVSDKYPIQVNPRAINLFYITKNIRERIVFEDANYKVLNTDITWDKVALEAHVNEAPECFSPNVIMRPLYQEAILPNLCYIGGGGELAYWFQLKENFKANAVVFPMLLLRNSVLIKTEIQSKKQEKLGLSNQDLFLKQTVLVKQQTKLLSDIQIDFTQQKTHLKKQFENLYSIAAQTDQSFLGAVAAQEKKQIKGLENLEKRLLKAQQRKMSDQLLRVKQFQDQLFPKQSLQERNTNFSELYLEYGDDLISSLIKALDPLSGDFSVLTF